MEEKLKLAVEELHAAADNFDSLARKTEGGDKFKYQGYANRIRECLERIR